MKFRHFTCGGISYLPRSKIDHSLCDIHAKKAKCLYGSNYVLSVLNSGVSIHEPIWLSLWFNYWAWLRWLIQSAQIFIMLAQTRNQLMVYLVAPMVITWHLSVDRECQLLDLGLCLFAEISEPPLLGLISHSVHLSLSLFARDVFNPSYCYFSSRDVWCVKASGSTLNI